MKIDIVSIFPEYFAPLDLSLIGRARAAGHSTGPDAPLFPNSRGGRVTRQRVGKILHEAEALANERLAERGRPPLPNTTPHTMRRTYI